MKIFALILLFTLLITLSLSLINKTGPEFENSGVSTSASISITLNDDPPDDLTVWPGECETDPPQVEPTSPVDPGLE